MRYFVLQYNEKAHEKDRGKLAGIDMGSGGYPWPAVTLGWDYLNHARIWPESQEADMRKYAAKFPELTVRELHVVLQETAVANREETISRVVEAGKAWIGQRYCRDHHPLPSGPCVACAKIAKVDGALLAAISDLASWTRKEVVDTQGDNATKCFSVWSEGYQATGESGPAMCHGMAMGATFKDACINLFKTFGDGHFFDADRMTYWGCRLFDNESDARKAFG